MFKYFGKFFENAKIYVYNYFNTEDTPNKIYRNLIDYEEEVALKRPLNKDDKQCKIDTLLFVRQFKNTYYKYTNKDKFNVELYNSFIDDEHFDGGFTAFDDDDQNIRIFDKYIIEYIKNRNDVLTFLQCKNKDVVVKMSLNQLTEVDPSANIIDVLFAIDLSEKELFKYCYDIIQNSGNVAMIKNIVFSLILKYKGEYIRIKLCALRKNNKTNHPYLILERFLL